MTSQMVVDFMVNGEMIKSVGLEHYSIRTKINMKGISLIINHMDKENIFLLMGIIMKVVSKKEGLKVKEIIHIKMVLNMKDNGRMGLDMVMAHFIMLPFTVMKDNGRKGIKMEEAIILSNTI